MKCIYHMSDLDGLCSAAIVRKKHPKCELVPLDYGIEIDLEAISDGETVFLVDFSLPMDQMIKLNNKSLLFWYDHHKTAIDEANSVSFKASGGQVLEVGRGACEITWKAIFPEIEVPKTVLALSAYDVWNHLELKDAIKFQYGMRLFPCKPDDYDFWNEVFTSPETAFSDYSGLGDVILRYQATRDSKVCGAGAFYSEFEEARCVVLNKIGANSLTFESVYDADEHDIMMSFGFTHGLWTVSLYSDKDEFDVSLIAKKHGGGGHRGAAGFQCHQLPFVFPKGKLKSEIDVVQGDEAAMTGLELGEVNEQSDGG